MEFISRMIHEIIHFFGLTKQFQKVEFFETEEAATTIEKADHYIDREEDYGEDD